jgi:protease-4
VLGCLLGLLALGAGGCKHVWIATKSQVEVVKPISNEIALETYPGTLAGRAGGLVEMPVPGCGACPGNAKIAMLDVDGLLLNQNLTSPGLWGTGSVGENPLALFDEKLQAIQADPSVCAVVLRINSPGGGVSATDMMWQELQRYRRSTGKPVVACLMDVAAGGGYYLATAADHIVAHPRPSRAASASSGTATTCARPWRRSTSSPSPSSPAS